MAIIDGLKLVAVAVVAHAVISMAQKLTPDWQRILIALLSFALLLIFKLAIMQIAVIVLGGLAGWFYVASNNCQLILNSRSITENKLPGSYLACSWCCLFSVCLPVVI